MLKRSVEVCRRVCVVYGKVLKDVGECVDRCGGGGGGVLGRRP